jgi:hypothetical protein
MSYQGSPFSPSSAATLRSWRISIRIRRPFLSVRGRDTLGVEAFRLDGAVLSAIENIEVPLLAAALSVGIVDSFEEQISGIRCTDTMEHPGYDRRPRLLKRWVTGREA